MKFEFLNSVKLLNKTFSREQIWEQVKFTSFGRRIECLSNVVLRPTEFVKEQVKNIHEIARIITGLVFKVLPKLITFQLQGLKDLGKSFLDLLDRVFSIIVFVPLYTVLKAIQDVAGAVINPRIVFYGYS